MRITRVVSDKRAREKPCLRCGYALVGSLDVRKCPECGLATWISLNPDDSLGRSNPDWLSRLAIGFFIAAIAQIILLGAIAVRFVQPLTARTLPNRVTIFSVSSISPFELIALLAPAVVALMFVSMPEGRYPNKMSARQWSARAIAILIAIALCTLAPLAFLHIRPMTAGLTVLFTFGALATTMLVLHPIAKRLTSRRAMKWAGILIIASIVTIFFGWIDGNWRFARFLPVEEWPGSIWIFLIAVTLTPIASIILCVWFAIQLRVARKEAIANWNSE